MGGADERRRGQFLGRARHVKQFQAGLVGQAVAFAGVHVFAGPNQVLPRVLAATSNRDYCLVKFKPSFLQPCCNWAKFWLGPCESFAGRCLGCSANGTRLKPPMQPLA